MRKAPVWVLAVTFISIFSTQFSFAAITPGTKCSKDGATFISAGKKYKCVKTANGMSWKLEMNENSYAIGPAGRLVYKYANGKQQRLDSKNKWQSSDSRLNSQFDPIRVAAYKSINQLDIDPMLSNITFEYHIQPFYPNEIANAIKMQSTNVAKRISPLLDKNLQIKLILVTEKNRDFIGKELARLIPNDDWLRDTEPFLKDYGTLAGFYSRSGTGGGSAFYLKDRGYGYYFGHTSSLATLKTYWPQVAPHEMSHVLQSVLAEGLDPANQEHSEGSPLARWQGHLIEGSANTLGMAWGFENVGWYSDEMDYLLKNDIKRHKRKITMNTESDAIKFMQTIESRNNEFGGFAYSAGQIIWEFYIGKYGAPKLIELFRNLPQTDHYSANLMKTIGKDRDQFYQEVAPYFLATWKRLS